MVLTFHDAVISNMPDIGYVVWVWTFSSFTDKNT
jgi:hypothetical protein